MKLKSPHLLLVGNPQKLIVNVEHLISARACTQLRREIDRNVKALFLLGEQHFRFAQTISPLQWRHKVSRLYYGAYNADRAVRLKVDGSFSTDGTDHKNVGQVPPDFPNHAEYANRIKVLREDRNLADYSHDSVESDLIISLVEADSLVADFFEDARRYIKMLGVKL
jgi:hypothetical protein